MHAELTRELSSNHKMSTCRLPATASTDEPVVVKLRNGRSGKLHSLNLTRPSCNTRMLPNLR